jgi:hypothetical protein
VPEAAAIGLVPGESVRVHLRDKRRVSGTLLEVGPGALVLDVEAAAPLTLLPEDVTRLRVKRRGVLAGAVLGGGAGAMGLGLSGLIICAVSSTEVDTNVPLCTAPFVLAGTLIGAGAGALLGLSLPVWRTVYARPKGTSEALVAREESVGALWRGLSHPGPVGELGVQLGYARELNAEDASGGLGARLHLLARLGSAFAMGPELAWYPIPSRGVRLPDGGTRSAGRQLLQLGGLVRVGVDLGAVRPSALLGLAAVSSRNLGFLAYSVGAEVEARPVRRLPPLAVELRYHDTLQALGPDPRFLTLGVGTRVQW